MRLIYKQGHIIYIQIEEAEEVRYFRYPDLGFFRGFGVTDYPAFFKMWLRRFPKPIIIVAVVERDVIGFVYLEDWPEGGESAKDGNPMYVIRTIEVIPKYRRRKVGAILACLAMAMVSGHIVAKPIDRRAELFFRSLDFRSSNEIPNPPVDMKRKSDHLLLPSYGKNALLQKRGIKRILPSISAIFKIKLDTLKDAHDASRELEKQINAIAKYAEGGGIDIPSSNSSVSEKNDVGNTASKRGPMANGGSKGGDGAEKRGKAGDGASFGVLAVAGVNTAPIHHNVGTMEGKKGDINGGKVRVEVRAKEVRKRPHPKGSEMARVAVIYSPRHVNHYHREKISLEAPKRIESILRLLRDREKVFEKGLCDLITDFGPATEEDLALVHERDYIKTVKEYCERGGGVFGPDMFFTYKSFEAATYAAGGAMKAVEVVQKGEYPYSIALIRPPGHHATRNKYGGFCIFNNTAVAARSLQKRHGVGRVAIVDWDAHAANGTSDIFYRDPTVLVVTIHQDPSTIYPRVGFTEQIGDGGGKGYNVNIPMPVMSSDTEYRFVFESLIIPLLLAYKPEFVIGVNGFDAYWGEPYTKLLLTSEGYYYIAQRLSTLYRERFSIVIEGGYHNKNPNLMLAILDAIQGRKNRFIEDPGTIIRASERDRIRLKREVKALVNEIKSKLKPYFDL